MNTKQLLSHDHHKNYVTNPSQGIFNSKYF